MARFYNPGGVAVEGAANVYVGDLSNNRLTKGTPLYFRFLTSTGSVMVSNGFFWIRLVGPSGSNVVIEASANFGAWTPVQTNALPPDGLDIAVPQGENPNQFFRARLAP